MDVNPFKMNGVDVMEETPKHSRIHRMYSACYPESLKGWIIFLLVLVIIWQVLVSFGLVPSLTFPAVDRGKYQAVFLTSGQVYFGHMKEVNSSYAVLEDIYYLRVNQELQPSTNQQQQISLIKLGNEIHGPEDEMFVPKSQIIFWENMRVDSTVVQAIAEAKKQDAAAVAAAK